MQPILTAEQIRAWDAYTIVAEPIHSIDLMERASEAFVNWFVTMFDTNNIVGVVCGTGNNGGDGLAIARLLAERDYPVSVWFIDGNATRDFTTNLSRMAKQLPVQKIKHDISVVDFQYNTVLIDAIFGSGLSRPIEGIYTEVIKLINASKAAIVSVDVPSGLMLDKTSSGEIVHADYTITFQIPKLAFMFPQNAAYTGKWIGLDIGLHPGYLQGISANKLYLDGQSVRNLIRKRGKFSHKGDHGRALLIAGSKGKMGACVLAAKATLRSGSGLLTVHVPSCGYDIIQVSVPEAMASIDVHSDFFTDTIDVSKYEVIGIGPGLGTSEATTSAFKKILASGKPMVIDADGLNIMSSNRELLHIIPGGSILTPHPGEFKRLVGEWKDDFHRLELQRQLSEQTGCVVVLKGAHTSITAADGEGVWFNSTGNPGMAKGGSGDVLTGVLTGLLAQKYGASEAAIVGVYFHGLAGDLAASAQGEISLVAGDIVDFLGQSFGH